MLCDDVIDGVQKHAAKNSWSFSRATREILRTGLSAKEKERADLKKLADEVFGSVNLKNHPEWSTPKKIDQWVRKLRAEWD